jgi:hypothetical protein
MIHMIQELFGRTLRKRRLSKIIPDFSGDECFTKEVALALLADQAMLCLGAVVTRVILDGERSYFIFAIAAGEPWQLS